EDRAHGRASHRRRHRPRAAHRRHAPRRAARRRHAGCRDGERDRAVRVSGGGAVSAVASKTLLSVEDLHVYLGQSHVLQGVSFDVPEGGVTALLGRNGVGKTTTLRAILGLVGRAVCVQLDGAKVTTLTTHRIVRRSVGYVPEDRDVFTGLTV